MGQGADRFILDWRRNLKSMQLPGGMSIAVFSVGEHHDPAARLRVD